MELLGKTSSERTTLKSLKVLCGWSYALKALLELKKSQLCSPSHIPAMSSNYDARFTGSGDPRRCVISALAPADTYLSFETVYTSETITTVGSIFAVPV